MTDPKVRIKLEETNYIGVLVAVFVIIVTLVIFLLYRKRKGSRNGILLTGLCDSGKTLIYTQLVHNRFVQTHTSIKENIGNYVINKTYLKVIDIPGHERLRDKFLEQYKTLSKGIVFIVDSLTVQQDVRDAAEFLYNILVDPVVEANRANVLILCNKQDSTFSKGSNVVKSMLEKELNTLRLTKSSQLDSVDPKAKRAARLGDSGKDFSFNSTNLKVEFGESYAFNKNGSVNIEDLRQWLTKIA